MVAVDVKHQTMIAVGQWGTQGTTKTKNTDDENNSRESSHTSVRESELEGEKEIQQKAKEEEKV